MEAILLHFKEMSTNEFGNYIIQTIIQRVNMSDLKIVAKYIAENMVELSGNKFSSYIIETIIRMNILEINQMMAQVLVRKSVKPRNSRNRKTAVDETDCLYRIMQDQ